MSRIYLTYSRLQGACNAGALIGRKTMGVGTWDANDSVGGDKALKIFDQNFVSGAYGSRGQYQFKPLFVNGFSRMTDRTISQVASMVVREKRDLIGPPSRLGIYNIENVTPATCPSV